jgi:dolichol kinase
MTSKVDTFLGSTLSLLITDFNHFNNTSLAHVVNNTTSMTILSLLSALIFIFNVNNHFLFNLILSFSTRSTPLTLLSHASSAVISGFLYSSRFKNSFKVGEIVLISQLTAKLVVSCHENRFKGWAPFFLLTNLFPLIFKFKSSVKVLSAFTTWIVFSAAFTLTKEHVLNLFISIFKCKELLFYWPSLLFFIILLPISFPKSSLFSNQNSLRKFYHFSAVALFLPAAFWSLKILKIALAVASTLFLYTEIIRNDLKANLKTLKFNEFMERCRNELDSGQMILSHFYLLIGCSLPFWLCESLNISSFSGVISLGIGDSLASIGGKRFGRTTWHSKTRKTLEGSFFGFIGMLISWIVLNELCSSKLPIEKIFFISISSCIWEALINLNDNLTLPLFTFIIFNKAAEGV